jgi:glycosyltransferase involved in cell wall biosynthesis
LNRFTDCIIYVSEAQRKIIQSGGHALPKHIVIHNGFDEKHFTVNKTGESIRKFYGFSEDDIIIGIVGRLVRQKGHEYLFEAVQKVKEKYSGVKLLVVGAGPEEFRLKELARNLQLSVVFLSGRDDVPELMRAMDIYVQPSHCEPFGISILEAMFSELPVVATDRGGIPELVQDEETGILLPSQDPQGISDAILRLIEDRTLAKRMGTRGREVVKTQFSGRRFAKSMEKLYTSFIEGPK